MLQPSQVATFIVDVFGVSLTKPWIEPDEVPTLGGVWELPARDLASEVFGHKANLGLGEQLPSPCARRRPECRRPRWRRPEWSCHHVLPCCVLLVLLRLLSLSPERDRNVGARKLVEMFQCGKTRICRNKEIMKQMPVKVCAKLANETENLSIVS